jgi:hypothetical protein
MADRNLRLRNNCDRITRYPVAASQSIKVGQPVALNGDGRVVIATAGSTKLLGVCAKEVSGTAVGEDVFVMDHPEAVFEIDALDPSLIDQDFVGVSVDLAVDSGAFKADLAATSTEVIRVVGIREFYSPVSDGVAYEGSALVGDFTPGWKGKGSVLVEIAKHYLSA